VLESYIDYYFEAFIALSSQYLGITHESSSQASDELGTSFSMIENLDPEQR
jgi:hypothetical protein